MQMNPIFPAKTTEAVDKAYRYLKTQIVTLKLHPGYRVRAQEVALELELSRTPVREALARLEHEGLLLRSGGWGYSVRGITEKEAVNLFSVRRALEKQAILETIPLVNKVLLETLTVLIQEQERLIVEDKTQAFREKSREFHIVIIAASQNEALRKILFSIDDQVRLIGAIIHGANSSRAREVLLENKKIYSALKSRNVINAVNAVDEHLARAMQVAVQKISDQATHLEINQYRSAVNN